MLLIFNHTIYYIYVSFLWSISLDPFSNNVVQSKFVSLPMGSTHFDPVYHENIIFCFDKNVCLYGESVQICQRGNFLKIVTKIISNLFSKV